MPRSIWGKILLADFSVISTGGDCVAALDRANSQMLDPRN